MGKVSNRPVTIKSYDFGMIKGRSRALVKKMKIHRVYRIEGIEPQSGVINVTRYPTRNRILIIEDTTNSQWRIGAETAYGPSN